MLKRSLRRSTKLSEDEIELLFLHMRYTNRLKLYAIQEGDPEMTICKLAHPSLKIAEDVTQKDKCEFSLKV